MDPHDLADLEGGATAIQAPSASKRGPTGFVLTVVEGPDRGQSFELGPNRPAPLLIGQSPSCDVRLTDRHVSRRHASLEIVGARIVLADLDSTNGTFVDGLSIGRAYLRGEEAIKIGATTFRLARRDVAATAVEGELRPTEPRFGKLVGSSRELGRLFSLFRKLAASDVPVVIEGETGTGKEVLAESIHEASPRSGGPFVVFDCTAVPANLMEAELFGHERGAFTGATATRKGYFEQASGGTLLIDEIGDLDLALQPKLLRVIERRELRRVGGTEAIKVDVRLLAATRRDLDKAVQEGRFRDDLYHRLAVGRVELPPLSKRSGDISELAKHFWAELGGAPPGPPPDVLGQWERASWPGNVRQLRNAVARRIALGELGDDFQRDLEIAPSQRGATLTSGTQAGEADIISEVIAQQLPLPLARLRVIEAFESRYIAAVLAAYDGNVALAAKASGIARRYFQILRSGKRRM
ncbi:MAG: sigma 54-dependent Fis family transcriptional regulator [Myxococcales bacterium]|nr:sigma 54-dependent Fis family transcriptional regulator [Myxococcales bacterium]